MSTRRSRPPRPAACRCCSSTRRPQCRSQLDAVDRPLRRHPATTKGALAISLSKGVLRVVGGVATHSEGATIRTPTAAIGLRGGIAIISYNAAKGTQAILGFGHMSVTTLCGGATGCSPTTVDVSRPGYSVPSWRFNKPPSSPGRVSSQELALSNSQLTSRSGQSGGASQQPTDNLAQSYIVGTPNSPGAPITQTASRVAPTCSLSRAPLNRPSSKVAEHSRGRHCTERHRQELLLSQVAPPHTSTAAAGHSAASHASASDSAADHSASYACPTVDLRHGHPQPVQHQPGLDREPGALSHRRLRRQGRLHGLLADLADPRLSERLQF